MNIFLFGPALSLLGVFAGSLITYHLTRRLNLQKDISVARQEAYIAFVNAVSQSAINAQQGHIIQPDIEIMMHDAKSRICLYGTKKVVERLSEFIDRFGVIDSSAAKQGFVEIIFTMRSELMPGNEDIGKNITSILFPKKIVEKDDNRKSG